MTRGAALLTLIKEKIHSKLFQSSCRKNEKDFSRSRKLPFPLLFSMILRLVRKSLAIECELLDPSGKYEVPSKQAFSKARYKISHDGFQELLKDSLKVTFAESGYGTWRGYRVIAADGSSLRLPDSPEIVERFGYFKPNGSGGKMPPLGRVSLFVDLCTSLVCSARLARWDEGEESLAREQLPEVVHDMRELNQDKLLFIYDRGYPSFEYIQQHRELGVDFIFRISRGCYKKIWNRVNAGETDFVCTLGKQLLRQSVRVIALKLDNGEMEVLITSLQNKDFSREDITKIYTLRWHVEECYKRLKIRAEIENFSGIGVEAIFQEFWATLLMCNILAVHMCDEEQPWDPDNIPEKRLNFSVLLGIMRTRLQQVLTGNIHTRRFQKLFKRAAQRAKIEIRPERNFSRDKVGKPKRHHVFRRVC